MRSRRSGKAVFTSAGTTKKPDKKALRRAIRAINDGNQASRVAALISVCQWYLVDFKGPLLAKVRRDSKFTSRLNKAENAFNLGARASTYDEGETALVTSLRLLEPLFSSMSLPSAVEAYKAFAAKKDRLEARARSQANKYQDIIDALNKVYSSSGLTITVGPKHQASERDLDTDKKVVSYSLGAVDELRSLYKEKGILAVLGREAKTLVEAEMILSGGTHTIDSTLDRMQTVFSRVSQLAEELGTKVVRKGRASSSGKRTSGASRKPRVAGHFLPGSRKAEAWTLLSDEKTHTYEDVDKVARALTGNPKDLRKGLLKEIAKVGKASGEWEITLTDKGAKMSLRAKGVGS